MQIKMKVCTKCGKVLDFSKFYDDFRNKDGKRSHCKDCVKSETANTCNCVKGEK